jgi:hypothetical protein
MPRVVPSQVVALIDQIFPFAATERQGEIPRKIGLSLGTATQLRTIADLVDQIPGELIVVGGPEYGGLVAGVSAIRIAIETWQSQPNKLLQEVALEKLEGGFGTLGPVTLIRRALALCPDESPAPGTSKLNFIPDKDLREALRRDIGSVENDLANGEWKGATVLAGSVIEALLLWSLQQRSVDVANAKANPSKPQLEKWDLHDYIEVASELQILHPDTTTQARLAKNFRNLIHPGRAIRLGQVCDRATALSAVAAMEHVIRDLS